MAKQEKFTLTPVDMGLCVALIAGIVYGALPAWENYQLRMQATKVFNQGAAVAQRVNSYFDQYGTLPSAPDWGNVEEPPLRDPHMRALQIARSTDGRLLINMDLDLQGQTRYARLQLEGENLGHRIYWRCAARGLDVEHTPNPCLKT